MLWFLPALVVEETVVKLSQAMTLLSMVGYNGGADGAFLYGLGGLQQVSFSSKIKKVLILLMHQKSKSYATISVLDHNVPFSSVP